jgi:hypothetical protein
MTSETRHIKRKGGKRREERKEGNNKKTIWTPDIAATDKK